MADNVEQLKQKIHQLELENSKLRQKAAELAFNERKLKRKIKQLELEKSEIYDEWFETLKIRNIAQIKNIDQMIENSTMTEKRQILKNTLINKLLKIYKDKYELYKTEIDKSYKDFENKIENNKVVQYSIDILLNDIFIFDVFVKNFTFEETQEKDHYNLSKSAFFQCLIEILSEYFNIAAAREFLYKAIKEYRMF